MITELIELVFKGAALQLGAEFTHEMVERFKKSKRFIYRSR